MVKTIKEFMISPKLDSFFLIKTDGQRVENRHLSHMWPLRSACLSGLYGSYANWINIRSSAPKAAVVFGFPNC
jgi:hypothetical protein